MYLLIMYYKKVHEECSFVYLANYIKLLRIAAFSLCIINYHINIVIKQKLLKGSIA